MSMDYGAKHPQCCEIKSLSALTKCVGLLFTFGCCGVDGRHSHMTWQKQEVMVVAFVNSCRFCCLS